MNLFIGGGLINNVNLKLKLKLGFVLSCVLIIYKFIIIPAHEC